MDSQKNKNILKNFQHMCGNHCETTSLRKVLQHFGCEYEEEFLLGIAGGAGFVNWYRKGMQTPFIGTRNGKFPYFITKACNRLQVDMEIMKTSNANKSLRQLMDILESGMPAICYGDIAKLPYFASGRNFGHHAFVVYGVDLEKEIVYISDRGGKPQKLPLKIYLQAHDSKCVAFHPDNAIIKITAVHDEQADMQKIIKESILETAHDMLYPPIKGFGVNGIHLWAEEIQEFESRYSGVDLCDYLVSSFINIETAGTGGKGFRQMYSRFLEIAEQLTNRKALGELSERCKESADAWREISYAFLPHEYFGDLAELILKKEAIFLERGNYETEPCKALLEKIDDRIQQGRKNSTKLKDCLPIISQKIETCYQIEQKLFTDLENVFVERE